MVNGHCVPRSRHLNMDSIDKESAMEHAAKQNQLHQPRCSLELLQKLDGAKWVRHDPNTHFTVAWFGGHGIHAYSLDGTEVSFWNVGDFAETHADIEEVRESIERVIKTGNYP